jgi:hypothetical protein
MYEIGLHIVFDNIERLHGYKTFIYMDFRLLNVRNYNIIVVTL